MPIQIGQAFSAPPLDVRTRTAGTLGASETIAQNALAMAVNGVAWTARSGAALAGLLVTLASRIAGAGADAGVVLCSHGRSKVQVQFLGGQSKTLSLDSIVTAGGTVLQIKIQLGTDSSSVVTSTNAQVADFINAHALLSRIGLRAAPYGDAGLAAVAALTAIALVGLLGWATGTYVNGTGADIPLEMTFALGAAVMTASGLDRTKVPSLGRVVNGTTVSDVFVSELDLPIRAVDVPLAGKVLAQVD